MSLINRFKTTLYTAFETWKGFNAPPSYNNPVYYDITTPEEKRIQELQALFAIYNGNHKKHFRNNEENYVLNYSKRIVDKSVLFLFGKPLVIDIDLNETSEKEQYLLKCFGSDETRQQLFIDMALNGSITGDYFVQISIDENGIPHFDNLDPLTVFPKFDDFNTKEIIEYEIRFYANGTVYRNRHMKFDNGTWYNSIEYQVDNNSRWVADESLSYVWNYPFSQIIHGRNYPKPNSVLGLSDLEDADINNLINFVASNSAKVSKMFSHPVIYGNGYTQEDIDSSRVLMSTDSAAKLNALQLTDSMSSNVAFLNYLKGAYAEITGVPESDRLSIGVTSGYALRVLNSELLLRTEVKRSFYGSSIIEMCKRALIIGGYGEENIIRLFWSDPLPVDENERVTSDKFDLENNIASIDTIRSKRGYNNTEEKEKLMKG